MFRFSVATLATADAATLAVTWSDCGAKHATVTDVEPTSIHTGATETITGTGKVDEDVTSAHFTATVSALGAKLSECDGDATKDIVCGLPMGVGSITVKAVSYPLAKGTVSIPVEVTTSSIIPPSLANVDVSIRATEQNGEDVICLDVHTAKALSEETGNCCWGGSSCDTAQNCHADSHCGASEDHCTGECAGMWCPSDPEPATTLAPEPATTAAPEPATTAAPEPETTAAPEPATTAAPEPATTAAPEPATTAAPEPDTTAAPEPDTTAAPEPDTTAAPEPDTTAAPEPDTTAAPEPDTTAAPEPDTTVAPEPAAGICCWGGDSCAVAQDCHANTYCNANEDQCTGECAGMWCAEAPPTPVPSNVTTPAPQPCECGWAARGCEHMVNDGSFCFKYCCPEADTTAAPDPATTAAPEPATTAAVFV